MPLQTKDSLFYKLVGRTDLPFIGLTPLQRYFENGFWNDEFGNNILHDSVKYNNAYEVKCILSFIFTDIARYGRVIESVNFNGETPIDIAKNNGFTEILNLLEECFE